MKNLVLTIVLMLIGSSFGVIVESDFHQNIELDGYSASLSGANQSGHYDRWGDYISPSASGSFSFTLDQGFMGWEYIPLRQTSYLYRFNDSGDFMVNYTAAMAIVPEISMEHPTVPNSSFYMNLFGIYISTSSSLGHRSIWNGSRFVETSDIQGNFSIYLTDSVLLNGNSNIFNAAIWRDGLIDVIEVSAPFYGVYTGEDIEAFNAIVMMIPEPATMFMFSLGVVLRRKGK